RELFDEVETFGGRQLVGPACPGPRAAVRAFQVAGERDLPHDVNRMTVSIVVVGLVPMRKFALAHFFFARAFAPPAGPSFFSAALPSRMALPRSPTFS